MRPGTIALALVLVLALGGAPALAAGQDRGQAIHEAFGAALRAAWKGPTKVPLRDQAMLALPAGYRYVPHDEAARLMALMGNKEGDDFIGLVMGGGTDASWLVDISYQDAGYVKDDDAKSWNADELLKSLKEGTAAANEERHGQGIPGFEVVDWVEKPSYDAANRRLVWAASTKEEGEAAPSGINYNTYALGREGYISMNLVCDLARIGEFRPRAKALLGALTFNDGKRYTDFNSSTDKVAAYGLAALVAGVAAHKLGLFALLAAFAVKFVKVLAVAAIAALAGLRKFFTGRAGKPAA